MYNTVCFYSITSISNFCEYWILMEVHIIKTKQRLLSVFYRHFYNFTEKIYNKINQNLSLLDADAIHTKSKVVRIQQVRIKFSISHIWNINVKKWQRFDIWPLLIVSQEWKKKYRAYKKDLRTWENIRVFFQISSSDFIHEHV